MTYSILHRATGVALSVGILLIPFTLYAIYKGEQYYYAVHWILLSPIGLFCMAGWIWSFFFHMFGGIRHWFWDVGLGFDKKTAQISGHITFIASIVCTILAIGAFVW